ncbi:MAG: hypothetical protein QJ16_C0009G0008 [archaeon GW2011_AR1]|nr:MAG: hypothetical protein QJ16_C0009G0008 [archaeon GW2011_AR1]
MGKTLENKEGMRCISTGKVTLIGKPHNFIPKKRDYGIGENQYYNQVLSSEAGSTILRLESKPYDILENLKKKLGEEYKFHLNILERGIYKLNWNKIKN